MSEFVQGLKGRINSAGSLNGSTNVGEILKGEKGDPGEPGPQGPAGADGQPGAPGRDGVNGKDGYSPIVAVINIEGGHRVTITDKDGAKTFDVMDGTTEDRVIELINEALGVVENGTY